MWKCRSTTILQLYKKAAQTKVKKFFLSDFRFQKSAKMRWFQGLEEDSQMIFVFILLPGLCLLNVQ